MSVRGSFCTTLCVARVDGEICIFRAYSLLNSKDESYYPDFDHEVNDGVTVCRCSI